MTTTRESLWSSFVDFAAEHAKPAHRGHCGVIGQCPHVEHVKRELVELLDREDVLELIDWLLTHMLREGHAIAKTRHLDGHPGFTAFGFDSTESAGLLASVMAIGAQRDPVITEAARTIIRFSPPQIGHLVVSEITRQVLHSLIERHVQMQGSGANL